MGISIDYALKAQQWERVKGELRALISLQGAYPSTDKAQSEKRNALGIRVEQFILDVEENALQE